MALRVANAHANKIRANGHHTPSSDRSTSTTLTFHHFRHEMGKSWAEELKFLITVDA